MGTTRVRGLMAAAGATVLAVSALAPAATAQDGEAMQMWGRDIDQVLYDALIDTWNAENPDSPIELTIIPRDEYVAKVAAAAAGGALPDLLGIDLIFMPDFINQGLLQPITEQVNGLEHKDAVSPGHIAVSTTDDGEIYAVPFMIDASSLFWNKELFEQAGLDPEKGPETWEEVLEAARAVNALGDDIYGFYFAGACGGCNAYTFLPQIWAAGGDVIDYENHEATLADDPIVREAYEYYKTMWDEGLVPESARAETASTWFTGFAAGEIGILPLGGGWGISSVKAANPDLDFGVTALPGKEAGQTASFAGGDVIALTNDAKDVDAAWAFIEWLLSDEVQLEIYAKNGAFTTRTDLADNEYAAEDMRYVVNNQALATGDTPRTLGYNEIFNDPNGPWQSSIVTAVFDGDLDGGLQSGDDGIQDILDQNY
jgi:multiple sugar transport system substrate-binding protein